MFAMDALRTHYGAFWDDFCSPLSSWRQLLTAPSLFWAWPRLLYHSPTSPAAAASVADDGFSCEQHALTLTVSLLLSLATLSHILVLRRRRHGPASDVGTRGRVQGGWLDGAGPDLDGYWEKEGRGSTAGSDGKADHTNGRNGQGSSTSNSGSGSSSDGRGGRWELRSGLEFWASLVLSLALAGLWSSAAYFEAKKADDGGTTVHPTTDDVLSLGGQSLAWASVVAAFSACYICHLDTLFLSARLAFLGSAMVSAIISPVSIVRVVGHAVVDGVPGLTQAGREDLLTVLSLPAWLWLGRLAYLGSSGLSFVLSRRRRQRGGAGWTSALPTITSGLALPLLDSEGQGGDEEGVEEGSEEAPKKLSETVTPYENAGLLGVCLFEFVRPVLEVGFEKVLTPDDVPQLRPADRAEPNVAAFEASWRRLRQLSKKEEAPPVTRALWVTFYPALLLTAVLALLKTVVMYAGPLLLNSFVDYAAGKRVFPGGGLALVLCLLVAKGLETIFDNQQNFRSELLGLNMQAALVGALFQKGLRLSSKAKQDHSVGEIVNYMSTDVQRLQNLCWELHNIWVLPLQIVIALAILFKVVGVSMVAGVGVMVGIMVANLVVATQQHRAMENIMSCKDKRMKATTEALKSMRVIKLYAWQEEFRRRIADLRGGEMGWITTFMYVAAINIFLLWLSPLAVSVATFATMLWLGQPLTAGSVFTAIATFRILQEPLRSFPGVISTVTQAMVSLKRLSAFLASPELQADAVVRYPQPALPTSLSAPDKTTRGAASSAAAAAAALAAAAIEASPAHLASSNVGQQGASGAILPVGDAEGEGEGDVEWAVRVEQGSFSWDGDSTGDNVTLRNINLQIRRGSRVAVCGAVGGGKSSLLSALLGEMSRVGGRVEVAGSVAYVPQSAWIQNCSVKDNILFGQPFDEARYKDVLRCCCLEKDLALFSHGDDTQIGERGVNLSGGQKQRIQLARALYHGGDVFLLDDPFSAVDAHTGSQLFLEYILGALVGKTVVLVTHQVEFLPAVDTILVMRGGEIVQAGNYHDLSEAGADLAALVDAHQEALSSADSATNLAAAAAAADAAEGSSEAQQQKQSQNQDGGQSNGELPAEAVAEAVATGTAPQQDTEPLLKRKASAETIAVNQSLGGGGNASVAGAPGQLIQEEEKESGHVSADVYWTYMTKALHGWHVPLLLLVQLLWQIFQIGSDWWLAAFTSDVSGRTSAHSFLRLYTLLALGSGVFVLLRTLVVSWTGLQTTQAFYMDMLRSVFRAPMAFFDSTPIGRILSRSSTDQSALDMDIPFSFGSLLAMCFSLFGILFVTSAITWPVLFAIVPLAYLYVFLQQYYLASSRELTRINGITRAPIIEHFSESLAGAAVIRAFGQQARFEAKSRERVDTNNRVYFHYGATTLWMGVHLELIGTALLCFSALMLISLPSAVVTPGLAGMSLSYGLALSQGLFYVVWVWCALENEMVSVERIQQYSSLPSEAPLSLPDHRLPPHWPSSGEIVFDRVQIRYRPDLPLVLNNVTLTVAGGAKVGVVGRTGSGKSTLIAALFRLVEASTGEILIDSVDIADVGLTDLRSHLAIIPQEPTLFEGSVRYNLDPLDQHSDDEIWEALDKCQLADAVRVMDEKLQASVAEGGENWSMGQRQLFCLGRALLRRSRILVLDEATASVDAVTDAVIQRTIRDNFASCTVLSVAHRIPTVMDSDRVLVMDQGQVAEYDTPAHLLEDPNSMFFKLVREYSARSSDMADIARSSSVENFAASGSNSNLAGSSQE